MAETILDNNRTSLRQCYALQELADLVQGDVEGDPNVEISGVRGIGDARSGDITFLANTKYFSQLQSTKASAVVIGKGEAPAPIEMIRVKNPNYAFAKIADFILNKPIKEQKGIHPAAVIGKNVKIGKGVTIHPYVVIADHVVVGDDTTVLPFSYLGHYVKVGINCLIYSHVAIRERCILGNNIIVHAGTVIGCDGFGYSTEKGKHYKIPQIGIVEIADDVEIGANVTIDRARFDCTYIGKGTKIDNLVQVAHNVNVGENCLLISQTGIAGSAKIGNNVTLAGQTGVNGHITIGDNTQVAGKSGVLRDVPPNARLAGVPAVPHDQFLRQLGLMRRLPELLDDIKTLKRKIDELEQKTKDSQNGS
ncbi:UDP-3-O-(3-hydroxymyristoyl)glucosamine N-acyltransferase [Planctomycetota bacterium]